MAQPEKSQIEEKKVYLPPLSPVDQSGSKKKTIVLDMDETLVHFLIDQKNITKESVCLQVPFNDGQAVDAYFNLRPNVRVFLKELSRLFEVIIFTASNSCYANVVIDYLDPDNEFITQRLYREHCIMTSDGNYVKDLRILANRNL